MKQETTDILAIGAHPDDVELNVGGTILAARAAGRSVAIVHATVGEAGTRGTPEIRRREAMEAARMLDVARVKILDLPDGRLSFEKETLTRAIVEVIRQLKPTLVLSPHIEDLHPDHAAVGCAVREAAFFAGIAKWSPNGAPWRPERVLQYMSHTLFEPHFIVDISNHFINKKRAAQCYASQFHDPHSTERATYISRGEFWSWWEGRAAHWGNQIGVPFGEPFRTESPIALTDPMSLISGHGKYRNERSEE